MQNAKTKNLKII